MSHKLAKSWINADEYERMGAASIFRPDERLELLEGSIYKIPPSGSAHAACVDFLALLFTEVANRRFIVRVQNPIRLDDFSEPQPDVTLLRWREDFYRGAHPTPTDVLLVVEVADATVVTDRTVKLPLYARAGVPEVWIVNLPDETIEVYAEPSGAAYKSAASFGRGRVAHSRTVLNLSVVVSDMLG